MTAPEVTMVSVPNMVLAAVERCRGNGPSDSLYTEARTSL